MITSIIIENIILVKQLKWQLQPGLCVLTGETGAGKSILLDALGFVLGDRANANLVRSGEKSGYVLVEIDISKNQSVKELLLEKGFIDEDNDNNFCIIRRNITSEGKSKAFINDIPSTIQLLKSIGQLVLEIHGQNDQSGLLDSNTHISVLDAYARLHDEIIVVSEEYRNFYNLQKQKKDLISAQEESAKQEDYLSFVVKELSELSPQEGEEDELADSRRLLIQKEKTLASMEEVNNYFNGNDSIGNLILSAQKVLIKYNDNNGLFDPVIEAMERASLEINGAQELFDEHLNLNDNNEQNLDSVEARLFALRAASRKYRVTVDELPKVLIDAKEKLSLIHSGDEALLNVEKRLKEAELNYIKFAKILSNKRKEAAKHLSESVMKELPSLKMENAIFSVKVIENDDPSSWNSRGIDKVAFYIQPNPGASEAAIDKIASGGELSRLMLALKVVLSNIDSVPTLIFDEVDTGIGGAVADAVGKRLSILSSSNQVIVITHQPQVAAKGSAHYKVMKKVVDGKTESTVTPLNKVERKEEIARMLSGAEITAEARAAAVSLMDEIV